MTLGVLAFLGGGDTTFALKITIGYERNGNDEVN